MKILSLAFAALIAVSLSGCLMVEVFEYTITIAADGHHATAESVYRNIEGSEDGDQADIDFNELITSWRGEQYVQDRLKVGVQVTDRQLTVVNGALVGRQTSIFTDSSPGYSDFFTKDTVRIAFLSKDIDTIVRTNGIVRRSADSTTVVWPRAARTFNVAIRFKLPGPGISLVPRFREYQKSQGK